jgi:hypothetical protein
MTYESVRNQVMQNSRKLEIRSCLHQPVENENGSKAKKSKIGFVLWKSFFDKTRILLRID